MKLSDFKDLVDIEVVRDGPFVTPGFIAPPAAGMLTFLESRKFLSAFRALPAVQAVITVDSLLDELSYFSGARALAKSARRAFFQLHNHLATRTDFYWENFPTEIHPSARVHPRAWVAERNVRIGAGSEIGPNVTICERSLIGQRVKLYPGVVIGSAGRQSTIVEGETIHMVHAGGVRIEDGVHILANAAVASAVFRQFTTIGQECLIGNLAFISHNSQIGPRSFVGHGSVVSGNVRTGEQVWIGPGATLIELLTIGDRAWISPGSCVIQDVPPDHQVTGNVAVDHRSFLRHIASISR